MANCILLLTVNRFLSSVYCKLLNGSCILQINNLLLTVYYHLYTSPCKPYSANCILLKVYVSLLTIYVAITCVRLVTIIFVVLKASSHITYFIKNGQSRPLFRCFFKQALQFLQQIPTCDKCPSSIWRRDLNP